MSLIAVLRLLGFSVCISVPLLGGPVDFGGWRFNITDCQEVDRPQGPAPDGGRYILRCRVFASNLSGDRRPLGLNWRLAGSRVSNAAQNETSIVRTSGVDYWFDEVWGYPAGNANGIQDGDGRLMLNVPARATTVFTVFIGDFRDQVNRLNSVNLCLRTTPTPRFKWPVLHINFRDVPVQRIASPSSFSKWNEAEQWNFRARMGPK
jgi:hypothetical protein